MDWTGLGLVRVIRGKMLGNSSRSSNENGIDPESDDIHMEESGEDDFVNSGSASTTSASSIEDEGSEVASQRAHFRIITDDPQRQADSLLPTEAEEDSEESVEINSGEEVVEISNSADGPLSVLPNVRVRRIIKADPEAKKITTEAVLAISIAAVLAASPLFLKTLVLYCS